VGLNDSEVGLNREKYGSNVLTKYKKNSFLHLMLESFGDPIIKILLIALAIKLVFIFKAYDWFETLGIMIAVFLASFISSLSEYGSEAAFERLQEESSKIFVKVKRNNHEEEIKIDEVVVNDIVVLSSGDKVPADGYLIKGYLRVDESSLNGETKDVLKESIKDNIIKKNNQVFRGSVVYDGNAFIKVQAVGDKTIYGSISRELQSKNPDSPLKIKLRDLAKIISKMGYLGAILASLAYLFMEIIVKNNFETDLIMATLTNFYEMADYLIYALTLSVTIIVVAVPEGLPMMITLVLSSNMKKMLKDNVLVRKLVGIETAGRMNVLLTDKTGTLTKGKLKVTEIVTYDNLKIRNINDLENYKIGKIIKENIYFNNECTIDDGKIIGGNYTDKSLMSFLKNIKVDEKIIGKRVLFNSVNKYSSVEVDDITYLKGASEVIVPLCSKYMTRDGLVKNIDTKRYLKQSISNLTSKGNRVIVMAMKKDNEYIYLGLVNIKDELREEAKEGINLIQNAGIKIIMITGDAKDTARAIATEAGLIKNTSDIVLSSEEFNKLSDNEIVQKINNIKVIARSMPIDKSRLVEIIEKMHLVVGMTGDGVNDAPALKKANVGFAMGSGTEVAKEASDIVILDDNILSISKSILYGRTIYKSIRKFIIYQLSINVCALIISIVGTLIGIQNPITIIQMLWLNMIMDTFAGLAFSFEPPLREYMDEEPKKQNESILNKYMYSEIIVSGLYSSLLCLLFLKLPFFASFVRESFDNKYLMTAYFAMFIFIGIVNAFNARTSRINVFANIFQNKVFMIIFLFITIVQIVIIYWGGDLFRMYGLTINEFIFVALLALSALPVDFIRKYIMKKKKLSVGV
jgi:P-type Ca2+ transporter type 2C